MRLRSTSTDSLTKGVKSRLHSLAGASPTLDLNFARSKSLVDEITKQSLVTFTRASSATFVNASGVIESATTNVPRFTHDPVTGQSLGLLVEEQRTNSIRNNTMVGAVAGTPGTLPTNWSESLAGLTRQVVATGTTNGISWVDLRFSGTPSGTAANLTIEGVGAVAAASGQTWTVSSWLALSAGTLTNVVGINLRMRTYTSVPAFIAQQDGSDLTLTGSLERSSVNYSSLPATTASIEPAIRIRLTVGQAVDFTLRIGLPQLEQGAFATSVIPTTNAGAVTRSADIATITGGNFSGWYGGPTCTVYAAGSIPPNPAGTFPSVAAFHDGTGNNRLILYQTSAGAYSGIRTGNVAQGDALASGTMTTGAAFRQVAGFETDNSRTGLNGTLGTTDTLCTLPSGLSVLNIGSNSSSALLLNSTISRLTYWPQRLPNATLQALTAAS